MLQTEGGHKVGTSAFITIKNVETQAQRSIKQGDMQLAKDLLEATIIKFEFEEPTLFMLCGEVNLKLGFLLIAEQMFTKATAFKSVEFRALTQLGVIA